MRTPEINSALERTLTRERLAKYLYRTKDNLDEALALYERNTRLSEAFYTPLQSVEVCLRNCLNEQMVAVFGENWLDNENTPLKAHSLRMIDDARREITKEPVLPDDIVAALRFAFWVSLLGRGYDATLWRRALNRAFAKGSGRPRKVVHSRLNFIRRFRNRVAHHEPIFDRNLLQIHDEILETIGWMSAETAAWTKHHSRVSTVIAAG